MTRATKNPGTAEIPERPSDNPAKLRAVTLAISRTKVKFGDRGVIEMYLRMGINVLDNTRGANEIEDTWSKAYDDLMEKVAKEAAGVRQFR